MRSLASMMMAILAAFAVQVAVASTADARQGGHGFGGGMGGGRSIGSFHGGPRIGNFNAGPRIGNFSRGPRIGNFSRGPRFGNFNRGPRIAKFYGGGPRFYKHSGRHFRRFRHRRLYLPYVAAYPYYYYGSSYGDSCYWLKRKAIRTGSALLVEPLRGVPLRLLLLTSARTLFAFVRRRAPARL